MFGTIVVLVLILVVAFLVDYRLLVLEGSTTQWVVYGAVFSVGFVVTALYLFNPGLPDPLQWLRSPLRPINAWLTS